MFINIQLKTYDTYVMNEIHDSCVQCITGTRFQDIASYRLQVLSRAPSFSSTAINIKSL